MSIENYKFRWKNIDGRVSVSTPEELMDAYKEDNLDHTKLLNVIAGIKNTHRGWRITHVGLPLRWMEW